MWISWISWSFIMPTVHLERFISASSLYEYKLLRWQSWSNQTRVRLQCSYEQHSRKRMTSIVCFHLLDHFGISILFTVHRSWMLMRNVLELWMILEDNSLKKGTSILMKSKTQLMASTQSKHFSEEFYLFVSNDM